MAYNMTVLNPASKKGKKMAKRKKKSTKKKTAKKRSTRKKTTRKKATKRKVKKKATKKKVKKKATKRKVKKKSTRKKTTKKKSTRKKSTKKKAAKKKSTRKAPARKKAAKKKPVRATRKRKRWPKKVTSKTTAGKKKTTRVPKIRYTVPQAEERLADAAAYVSTSKRVGKRTRSKLPGLSSAAQRMQLKSQGYLELNPVQSVPGFPGMYVRTAGPGDKSRKSSVVVKTGSRSSTRAGRGSTKSRKPSKARQDELDRIRKKYGIKKKR